MDRRRIRSSLNRKLCVYNWTINNYNMIKPQPNAAISPDFFVGVNAEGKVNIRLSPSNDNNLGIEILLQRASIREWNKKEKDIPFTNAVLNLEFLDSKKRILDYYKSMPYEAASGRKVDCFIWNKEVNVSRFIVNNSLTICAKISLHYFSRDPYSEIESIRILAKDMKKLIGISTFADVVVNVGDKRFFAHKSILLPQLFHTEHLKQKLIAKKSVKALEKVMKRKYHTTDVLRRDYDNIYIDNENSDVFLSILHYFYAGNFYKPSVVNDFDLYEFAKKYQLIELCKYLTPDKMHSSSVIKSSKVIFYWHIEDFRIRSLEKFNLLQSPKYKLLIDNEEISWNVSLFFFDQSNIFLSLQRNVKCGKKVQAVFKLTVCNADGTSYQEREHKHYFSSEMDCYYPGFLDPESRFTIDPTLFCDDTLTIRCELSVSGSELTSDSISTHAEGISKLTFKYWLKNLQNLLESKKFSDITLVVNEKEIRAHKSILAARSPVFARMLECEMMEKLSGCIQIDDISSAAMECAINFIYTGKLENLLMINASELYRAADKYEIIDLRDRCREFILENLDVDSSCGVLILADLYNEEKLKSAARNLILRSANTTLSTSSGLELMTNHPHLANDILESLSAAFCSLPPQAACLDMELEK